MYVSIVDYKSLIGPIILRTELHKELLIPRDIVHD